MDPLCTLGGCGRPHPDAPRLLCTEPAHCHLQSLTQKHHLKNLVNTSYLIKGNISDFTVCVRVWKGLEHCVYFLFKDKCVPLQLKSGPGGRGVAEEHVFKAHIMHAVSLLSVLRVF